MHVYPIEPICATDKLLNGTALSTRNCVVGATNPDIEVTGEGGDDAYGIKADHSGMGTIDIDVMEWAGKAIS